jgi:DNA-binding MarR family transcriptional regulator
MARTLLDEIKQTKPFPTRGAEAVVALLRTANELRRRGEELVQQQGLTMQQYNVLRILRGARAPLPTMEIAERMIEPAPGITRHINNLEERGLVRREQWGGDRRCVLCQISPAGLKLLDALDAPIDAWDKSVTRDLSEEQVTDLLRTLDIIRASLT